MRSTVLLVVVCLAAAAVEGCGGGDKNHGGSLQLGKPDLAATGMSVSPATVTEGTTLTFTFAIDNLGSAPAGPHQLSLYKSPDPTITTADDVLETLVTTGISAGAHVDLTVQGTVTNAVFPPGTTFHHAAIVDDRNAVDESNESNNTTNVVTTTVQ